jgi:hypothetical protein
MSEQEYADYIVWQEYVAWLEETGQRNVWVTEATDEEGGDA